jgi:hypothetical protein
MGAAALRDGKRPQQPLVRIQRRTIRGIGTPRAHNRTAGFTRPDSGVVFIA